MYSLNKSATYFSEHEVYPCPICRYGEISPLSLMDAMACNSCRHIFTTEVEKQQIKMADRQPPLIWRWNGRKWTEAHLEGVELGWAYWVGAIAFVIFPTTLLGLTAYVRPPVSGSLLSWLPTVWTGLAFLLHLGIVLWLVIEFYEFPVQAYLSARRQQIFGR